MDNIREESGLAIRFPRFTGNYRFDKCTEDAATVIEIVGTHRTQLKKDQRMLILNAFTHYTIEP